MGRGYVAADRHPAGTVPAGAIALDAAFSPIQRVSYNVENARLGKITDYEKLIVEIWTNGAVSPDEALSRAATPPAGPLRPPRARGRRGGGRRGRGAPARASCRRAWPSRSRICRCPRAPSTRSRTPRSSWSRTSCRRPTRISEQVKNLGDEVHRRDQDRARRARPVARHANRPEPARGPGPRRARNEARQGRVQARAASPRTAGRCSGTCSSRSSATSGS